MSKVDDFEKIASQFIENFRPLSELEGLIIRSHILIERILNFNIEKTIIDKGMYNPDRFSFSQKLQIGMMLELLGSFEKELFSLNKLRNQVAHSLQYDEKLVDLIISEIELKKIAHLDKSRSKEFLFGRSMLLIGGALSRSHEVARLKFTRRDLQEKIDKMNGNQEE